MTAVEQSIRSDAALEQRRTMYSPSCRVCEEGAQVAEQILDSGLGAVGGEINYQAEIVEVADDLVLVEVSYEVTQLNLVRSYVASEGLWSDLLCWADPGPVV